MKTQSVIAQGTGLFGSSAGSATKGYKGGHGFDLMMDSNLKSLQTSPTSQGTAVDKSSTSRVKVGKEAVKDTLSENVGQAKLMKTVASSNDAVSTAKDVGDVSQMHTEVEARIEDEPSADDELLAQIMTMLQSIQDAVIQQLNLTTDNFDQLLSNQGLSLTDLLQPENLQQLILASNGQTDISAVLTDENLAAKMNDIINSMEEIKADADLGLSEEQLLQLLKQANSKEEAMGSLLTQGLQEQLSGALNLKGKVSGAEAESEMEKINKEASQKVNTDSQSDQAATATNTVATAKEGLSDNPSDARQNEQKELKAADQFQTFIDNMIKATTDLQVDFNGNLTQVTELRDIADQILNRIKVSVSTNQASMELQLNPEHLGKVNLTVQAKNGIMTAQFVVQNEISKEAIESQLHVLRETLNSQGVKVEAIEVTVSAYAFERNTDQESGNQQEANKSNTSKKISLEDALSMSDTLEDSSLISPEAIGLSGSQINYTA